MLDRARRVPDVEFAALSENNPMRKGENSLSYRTSPAPVPASQELIALASTVTPDYLKVMGIPPREGRFSMRDQMLIFSTARPDAAVLFVSHVDCRADENAASEGGPAVATGTARRG